MGMISKLQRSGTCFATVWKLFCECLAPVLQIFVACFDIHKEISIPRLSIANVLFVLDVKNFSR